MPAGTEPVGAVSFDLFGTLVAVERPSDPAAAVARALDDAGVSVPADWSTAFREHHVDAPAGAELPLAEHVAAALASRGRSVASPVVERAVRTAYEPAVRTREGAAAAVDTLADRYPVGVLSNCSVRGLAERAIERSRIDEAALDAVVTSVDCGWRKPDPRAFRAAATALAVDIEQLCHVGDDPRTDGGASECGASAILIDETPIADVSAVVEGVS